MKQELIHELFQKFEEARYLLEGIECWSARELQEIFGYTEWRNFIRVHMYESNLLSFPHRKESNKVRMPRNDKASGKSRGIRVGRNSHDMLVKSESG